jgi:hypothetical protein
MQGFTKKSEKPRPDPLIFSKESFSVVLQQKRKNHSFSGKKMIRWLRFD